MSSTVTTATVTVVTSATAMTGFGNAASIFTLISVILLAAFLVGKEISVTASGGGVKRFARGLDVGAVPLLVGFFILMALRTFA